MLLDFDFQLRPMFKNHSILAKEGFVERMYYASQGSVDTVMNLVRDAAKITIERESDGVEIADLAQAVDSMLQVSRGKVVKPFLIEGFTLSKYPITS